MLLRARRHVRALATSEGSQHRRPLLLAQEWSPVRQAVPPAALTEVRPPTSSISDEHSCRRGARRGTPDRLADVFGHQCRPTTRRTPRSRPRCCDCRPGTRGTAGSRAPGPRRATQEGAGRDLIFRKREPSARTCFRAAGRRTLAVRGGMDHLIGDCPRPFLRPRCTLVRPAGLRLLLPVTARGLSSEGRLAALFFAGLRLLGGAKAGRRTATAP